MVLANLDDKDKKRIINATVNKSSVHDLLIHSGFDIPDSLTGKINKLKGNTFQEGVLSNMIEGIKASINQPFSRVLFALGIRNIGENTAQLLADHFGNIDALMASTDDELLEINGIGATLVNSLRFFFANKVNIQIIDRLKRHGLQFQSKEKETKNESNLLAGKKILASGKFNHFKRDEIIDFIVSHGGIYTKSVSKNLDFIIEGEEMGPSKKEKALKLGIRLISENDFLQIFS
jgi:DNA ligase (NAD+)